MDRMRIAVLLGQADEQYQSDFLKGFLSGAYANNADICFSSIKCYMGGTEVVGVGTIHGETVRN